MTPTLKRVFLVHGEPEQAQALAVAIRKTYGIEAEPAALGKIYQL